jgi:ATP-binding cassette subfamily B protein RaxB
MRAMPSPSFGFWTVRRLPLLLQGESAECGLACVAMVAGYWGRRIDLSTLRQRHAVSLRGATLKDLIGVAQALSFQARPLKLDLESLRKLQLPCILHWDMNHFVVLKRARRASVVVHDPAVGERRLAIAEMSKHFTGVALELRPDAGFEAKDERQRFTLRSLMGRVVGLERGLLQLLLLGLALQVVSLVMPFYLQWTVDEALVAADRDLIAILGIGFLLLALVHAAIQAVRSWVGTVLSTQLNFQWLGNAFAHLMTLPLQYFEKRHLGDIVSRFGSIQTIQRSITTQFVEGLLDGVLATGTLVVMLLYSVPLASIACAVVGLYAAARWAIFRAMREANAEQILHAAKQQTHFLESSRGVQSIRLFDGANERRIGWTNLLADQFNAELRLSKLSISGQTANTLFFGAERVVVIWLAALMVIDGRFSMGMLFAFISYKEQFSQRIVALVDKLFDLRMLGLHAARVADIVLSRPEAQTQDASAVAPRAEGTSADIEFRNVSFRYADGEPWIVRQLGLFIPAGQCVAITGTSGCGKTTLIKLLLGLLEPSEGEIRAGGVDPKRLGWVEHRRRIGAVMQEDYVFSGSIADNIAFFDPSPDQRLVEESAVLASIHREILAMPMGYHTRIGDSAAALSGGQRQRILLARALYKRPRVLVLDEATSHLDLANEHAVNAAIRGIALTRIIVAHRPETIAMAERVVVLEGGRIVRDLLQSRSPPQGASARQEEVG